MKIMMSRMIIMRKSLYVDYKRSYTCALACTEFSEIMTNESREL